MSKPEEARRKDLRDFHHKQFRNDSLEYVWLYTDTLIAYYKERKAQQEAKP